MLDRVRIVLVRPQRAGNVGAACRAMMNLGLRELRVVAPDCDLHDPEALGFAMRAHPLLDAARIYDDIPAALADCVLTLATSGKGGMYRKQAAVDTREAARLCRQATENGPVAVVFGPEDRGLLQEEMLLFDRVVEIPTDPAYEAMNLAAAVAVVCYELRMESLTASPAPSSRHQAQPAPDAHKRRLYEKLFASLDGIGFFRGHKDPDHLKYALRRIFGRADLSEVEADILIGMAQQIDWWRRNKERDPS